MLFAPSRTLALLSLVALLAPLSAEATTRHTEAKTRANPQIATPEAAKADFYSGGIGYTYKLDLPPAGGIVPELALSFSSLTGNTEYGRGWSLNLSKIERSTRWGPPKYQAPSSGVDRFELDGAMLVQDPDNTNRFHLEQTDHRRILYIPASDSWEVTAPDGTRFLYGSREGARSTLDNAGRQSEPLPLLPLVLPLATFRWGLDKVIDPRGNWYEIDYEYETFAHPQPEGSPAIEYNMNNHPDVIRYSYHDSEPAGRPRRIVYFQWGMRGEAAHNDDRPTSYRSGVKIQISQRLTDVIVGIDTDGDGAIGAGERVRRYEFLYAPKSVWGNVASETLPPYSQLAAIQRYEKTDADVFPSRTDFTYTRPSRGHHGSPLVRWKLPQGTPVEFQRVAESDYLAFGTLSDLKDMNGDGFVDFIWGNPTDASLWVAYGPVAEGGSFADGETDWGFGTPVQWDGGPDQGFFVAVITDNLELGEYDESWTSQDITDMDGDGLPDLVLAGYPWRVYRNLGDRFSNVAEVWGDTPQFTLDPWHRAANIALTLWDQGVAIVSALVDVNGDGRPDHVTGANDGQEFDQQYGDRNQVWVTINNGVEGFAPPARKPVTDWVTTDGMNLLGERYPLFGLGSSEQISRGVFADVNGDGLADKIAVNACLGAPFQAFSLGDGWQSISRTGQGYDLGGASVDHAANFCEFGVGDVAWWIRDEGLKSGKTVTGLLDLNGDGINDYYHNDVHRSRPPGAAGQVWFGLGDGTYLTLRDQPLDPTQTNIPPGVLWRTRFTDQAIRGVYSENIVYPYSYRYADTIDMNGDGLLDQVYYGSYPGDEIPADEYWVGFHPGPEGLLETVTNELGGVTRLTYKPSTWFRGPAQAATPGEGQPETTLPASVRTAPPQWLLASITVEDGRTTAHQEQAIEYAEVRYDTERHQYLGARMAESVDTASVLTRRFFHQTPDRQGRLEFVELEDAASNVLRTEKTIWTTVPTLGESGNPITGSWFAKPEETQSVLRDPTSPNTQTRGVSRTFDDPTGNLLTKTDWGADGSEGTGDDLIRTLAYAPTPSGDWMTSYVTEESLYFGSVAPQNRVSSVRSHYDTATLGQGPGPDRCTGSPGTPCGGLLSFRETLHATSSETWAAEHWTYDTYGNVAKYFDPLTYLEFSGDPGTPATRETVFGASGAFPETVTNALGHQTHYRFDEGLGQLTRALAPSGYLQCSLYDGLGRLAERRDHGSAVAPGSIAGNCDTPRTSFGYNDVDLGDATKQRILETREAGEALQVRSLRFFDGLGRVYQTEDEYKQGEFDVVKRSWGDRGELACETLPYRRPGGVTGWTTNLPCNNTNPTTGGSHRILSYDALLRATQVDLVGKEGSTFGTRTELTRSYGVNTWVGSDPGLGDLLVERRVTWTGLPAGQDWNRTQYIGRNPRGEVVFVREDGDNAQTTVLERDPKGRITRVNGPDVALESEPADANLLAITYNPRDQRQSVSQPRTLAGTGGPTWGYQYDLNGDLDIQVSPRGIATKFHRDPLRRLVLRDYAPFHTPAAPGAGDVVFDYYELGEGSGEGLGRLESAYAVNGFMVTDFGYDLRGRLATKTRDFGGIQQYAFGYAHDLLGRPKLTTLPDLGSLVYSYDGSALTTLRSNLSGGATDVLVSGIERHPSGGLTDLRLESDFLEGPPVDSAYTYSGADHRLESAVTVLDPGGSPSTVQNLAYSYDWAGNLLTAGDPPVFEQEFSYDRLHRLLTAEGTGTEGYGSLSYEYDPAGNLLSKGPGTTADPEPGRIELFYDRPASGGPPSVVAVDYYNGSAWYPDFGAFDYDADGGMIERRVFWSNYVQPNGRDSAGRIYYTKLPGGSSVYAFYYHDHDDVRIEAVKMNAGNILSYRQYVDESFEADWVTGTHELHLFVGDRRVATSQRPGMGRGTPPTTSADDVLFYHADHVGSNTVVTDGNGLLRQETFLTPFGEVHKILDQNQQVVSNPDDSETPYLFTDQERDPETDLHYFGARYYDPWVGRFLSQDPELISAHTGITFARIRAHAQSLNPYAYVLNRPTVAIDRNGRWVVWVGGGVQGGAGWGGTGFRGLAFGSGRVRVATVTTAGVGGFGGIAFGWGLVLGFAPTIEVSDLEGPAGQAGISAALGGVDAVFGVTDEGDAWFGGEVQVGPNPGLAPLEAHGFVTTTMLTPLWGASPPPPPRAPGPGFGRGPRPDPFPRHIPLPSPPPRPGR